MAVWLVRAGRQGEREDLALDSNLALIGWDEVPDLASITSREALATLCHEVYSDVKPQTLSTWIGQIWSFKERMQIDDLIALPLKRSSAVAIGKVKGSYQYRPDLPSDARHTRPVEWIRKDIPRSAFDQDILFSLGSLLTVCQVQRNHAEERIRFLLNGRAKTVSTPTPPEFGESVIDTGAPPNLEEYARDQIRSYIGQKFRGHELARLVTALLNAQGYKTQMSPPGPDGGVDIIAGRGPLGFDSPRLCVQVKSSDLPIDVNTLRALHGVIKTFGAEQGLFVSWGGFKRSVLDEARRIFFEIRLWDADHLVNTLLENYDQLPEDLKAEFPLKRIWTLVSEEE